MFLLQSEQIKSHAHFATRSILKSTSGVSIGYLWICNSEQQLDTLNRENLTCLFMAHRAFMDEATLKEAQSKKNGGGAQIRVKNVNFRGAICKHLNVDPPPFPPVIRNIQKYKYLY